MPDIVPPSLDAIVDKEGKPTAKFFQWLQLVSLLDPIFGDGSPEGNVEAREKRLYLDTTGNALYIKKTNAITQDRTKGWIAI